MDTLNTWWSSTTSTLSSYWENRPTWLGGPAPQPVVSTAVGGRNKRTFRKHVNKIRRPRLRRRRTGRKSNHP